MDISYSRSVSAPYSANMSSGVTEFLRLLPIFPYSRVTGWPFQTYDPSTSSTSSAGT
jgi:hypothetical protein